MENKEAINLLAACLIHEKNYRKAELYNHCINTLLKEEPLEAIETRVSGISECPSCRMLLQPFSYYCSHCGQKIMYL